MNRFKNVKLTDLLAGLIFLLSLLPSVMFKIYLTMTRKKIWLVAEENEARDNGYVFFEYMKREHKDKLVYYAINKKSIDYNKVVDKYGKNSIVEYASLKHWIYYLNAEVNISSQKSGKPNAAVCYVLEVYGILKNKRVFLQHGIILNDTEFLHYPNTKMRLFITGALPEHQYVLQKFKYPAEYVKCCGMCRFDTFNQDDEKDERMILLMPTWRSWLKLKGKEQNEIYDIANSEYVNMYNRLINDDALISLLEKEDKYLYFYPHRNAQSFLNMFHTKSDRIILCDSGHYDVSNLLKKCRVLITDYSSVSIDVAYMKKPVIYFQFDHAKFRKVQYDASYFDYKTIGFATYTETISDVVQHIQHSIDSGFEWSKEAEVAHQSFFGFSDRNNCRRCYEAILGIL